MINSEKTHKPKALTQSTKNSSSDLKQLHVNIPMTLHKRFRIKVLEEGRSMGQVIEDLIKNYVDQ